MNNNTSTSEYSSGCESGWTMYLDHNSISNDPYTRSGSFFSTYEDKAAAAYSSYLIQQNHYQHEDEEEDEDLSMVSDASSGPPPHYHNSQHYPYTSEGKTKSRTRKEAMHQSLCLDDTASSSIFHFSQSRGNAPRSDEHKSVENVYSTLHFEDESIQKKRLSFFHSSTKAKSGRKRQ